MEINSLDDVNALSEYHKIENIEKIEKKIKQLKYTPITSIAVLFAFASWCIFSGNNTWSPTYFSLIAITIGSVGYSNVQRTDLLKELFELKYGK
jgi:hypothetical protein